MASPTVLVVDDDRDTRDMFAAALSFVGFVVSTAPDGLTALRQMWRKKPDAILVDLALPDMNGVEMVGRLRAMERRPTPILVATGERDFEHLRQADQVACSVLTKPCDLRELAERLEVLIRTCPRDCAHCNRRD